MQSRMAGGATVRWIRGTVRGVRVGVGTPSRSRRARALAGVGAVVALASVALVGFAWWAPWCRVDHVAVVGEPDVTHRREVVESTAAWGQPLVKVDDRAAERAVMGSGRYVSVQVTRRWLSTVLVDVEPRVPVVGLVGARGQVELLDSSGAVIEVTDAVPDAVVRLERVPPHGSARRAAVGAVLAFDADQRRKIRSLRVGDSGVVVFVVDGVEVVWGDGTQARLKADVVEALLRLGDVRRIDVTAPGSPATTS